MGYTYNIVGYKGMKALHAQALQNRTEGQGWQGCDDRYSAR
ncbi:hypothetical protein ACFL02_09275 [Planctomycetota bacterium]